MIFSVIVNLYLHNYLHVYLFRTYCTTICNKWILKKNMKASLSITRRSPSPPPVAAAWQPPPSRSRTSPLSAAANAPLSPKLFPSTTSMGSPLLTTPTTTHSWAPDETSGGWIGSRSSHILILYICIYTIVYIYYISAVYALFSSWRRAAHLRKVRPRHRPQELECRLCFIQKKG